MFCHTPDTSTWEHCPPPPSPGKYGPLPQGLRKERLEILKMPNEHVISRNCLFRRFTIYCLWLLMWNRRLPLDLNTLPQTVHSMFRLSRWWASMWSLILVECLDVLPHWTHCQIVELSMLTVLLMKDWTVASMSVVEKLETIHVGLSFHSLWIDLRWKESLPLDLKYFWHTWHSRWSPSMWLASMWSFRLVQTLDVFPHWLHWYSVEPSWSEVFRI